MEKSVEYHAKALSKNKREWDGGEIFDHTMSLARIGTPKAVDALLKALNHKDWRVASRAAESLSTVDDPRIIVSLTKTLWHENQRVAYNSAYALQKIADESAIKPLIKALGHDDMDVRYLCMQTLIKIGKPAVPELMKALKSNNKETVVARSAEALGDIGDKKALPALMMRSGYKGLFADDNIKEAIKKIQEANK